MSDDSYHLILSLLAFVTTVFPQLPPWWDGEKMQSSSLLLMLSVILILTKEGKGPVLGFICVQRDVADILDQLSGVIEGCQSVGEGIAHSPDFFAGVLGHEVVAQ